MADENVGTILLVAPAGYGKTTVVDQWLARVSGVRLTLSPADCDVPVLARNLSRALVRLIQFDTDRIDAALATDASGLSLIGSIGDIFASHDSSAPRGWLALDDYHHISAHRAASDLVAALENSGLVNLMIASRERPHWATARRFLHLDLVELGASDLAFDDSEIEQVLPGDLAHDPLLGQARGWPAVISLAGYARSRGVMLTPDEISASFYDYFADELFSTASTSAQVLLMRLAIHRHNRADLDLHELPDIDALGEALTTGLVQDIDNALTIHPLARRFLLQKASAFPDRAMWIMNGLRAAYRSKHWDDVFWIIQEFEYYDDIERLVCISMSDLVENGRFVTLKKFLLYGETHGSLSTWVKHLGEAEIALSNGELSTALQLGRLAGSMMPGTHELRPRSFIVAGEAARLMHRLDDALSLHTEATNLSQSERDIKAATWGRYLATLSMERCDTGELGRELEALPRNYPEDRLRLLIARCTHARLGEGFADFRIDENVIAELLLKTGDPWVRTSWRNMFGYVLMLQGDYAQAREILIEAQRDVIDAELRFALDHVEWSLAAIDLGLRDFAQCDKRLRVIEARTLIKPDIHAELNVRVLRARLAVAQQNARGALSYVEHDFSEYPSRAMHGEYLSTRAMVYSLIGRREEALELVARADGVTQAVETQVTGACVRAIVARDFATMTRTEENLLSVASRLDVWDGVLCAIRGDHSLLTRLIRHSVFKPSIELMLRRSNDARLARSIGLHLPGVSNHEVLSPREDEVLRLIASGLKSREIAAALYIEPSTVKSHVQRILEKLGCKTRAEAVARYAERVIARGDDS